MSDPAEIHALQEAIRHLHGLEARWVATEHVREVAPSGEVVWDGDVEVFTTDPDGVKVYAWSEKGSAEGKRRFFAVLGAGAITSATMAVRGSILKDVGIIR